MWHQHNFNYFKFLDKLVFTIIVHEITTVNKCLTATHYILNYRVCDIKSNIQP